MKEGIWRGLQTTYRIAAYLCFSPLCRADAAASCPMRPLLVRVVADMRAPTGGTIVPEGGGRGIKAGRVRRVFVWSEMPWYTGLAPDMRAFVAFCCCCMRANR